MLPTGRDIFLRLYQELDVLTHDRQLSPEEAVRCGAILRQVLTDGQPLLHQVNRGPRLKIDFVINSHMDIEEFPTNTDIVFQGLGLCPLFSESGHGQETVALDKFLGTTILQAEKTSFTVRDLIDFLANKAGGVHLDQNRNPREEHFEEVLRLIFDNGYPSIALTTLHIATITLMGLRDLRDQVGAAA